MSTPKALALVAGVAALGLAAAAPAAPHFGRPASAAEVARADITILPSGDNLPAGSGSVAQGAAIFVEKCQTCHGPAGAGATADRLSGGIGTLASPKPIKTVASYWPYATTVFDYVRRAMPLTAPQSLKADEVYALTAYLLSIDGIVPKDAVMDARSLPAVRMPNRDGFVSYAPGARPAN
jgi:cytochrome c